MFDLIKLRLTAGDGGNGKVSFRREKFIPKGGPDGGNAGDGGSVYLRGNKNFNTLQHFAGAKEFCAQNGEDGGRQRKIGKKGEDIFLDVPIGTIVWLLAENRAGRSHRLFVPREGALEPEAHFQKYYLQRPQGNPPLRSADILVPVDEESIDLVDQSANPQTEILEGNSVKNIHLKHIKKVKLVGITQDGEIFLICKGGFGGRGNDTFKSSTNTTPQEAEYGTFGEKKVILFELKLLADIGLVGYPNVGKSTFLSTITKANTKIANYPFTTLEPNLGVMQFAADQKGDRLRDIVIADIPGLIEGASAGKGLGFDFLRHVEACKFLFYMLTLDEADIFDTVKTDRQKAEAIWEQYTILKNELSSYDEALTQKPNLIGISKADLYSDELKKEITRFFKQKKQPILFFSAASHQGIDELKTVFREYVSDSKVKA